MNNFRNLKFSDKGYMRLMSNEEIGELQSMKDFINGPTTQTRSSTKNDVSMPPHHQGPSNEDDGFVLTTTRKSRYLTNNKATNNKTKQTTKTTLATTTNRFAGLELDD